MTLNTMFGVVAKNLIKIEEFKYLIFLARYTHIDLANKLTNESIN